MIKLKGLLTQDNNQKRVELLITIKTQPVGRTKYRLIVTPTRSDLVPSRSDQGKFRMAFTNVFKDTEYTLKHRIEFMALDRYVADKLKQIAKSVGYDSAKFAQVLKTGGSNGSPKYPWLNCVGTVTLPTE